MTKLMIRMVILSEAKPMHALAVRSKAHWGYDAAFMALAAPALQISEDRILSGLAIAAEVDGKPVGVAALAPPDDADIAELEHLFVDPAAMGQGVGAALLSEVFSLARREGARAIRVLSDPQARGFYERHGFRWTHDAPSDAIPGRVLPVLQRSL
jgi:GNAT superfamily N-acetyltransferase